MWVLLLVYGSLLPFDLEPARFFEESGGVRAGLVGWLSGPGWVGAADYGGPTAMGFSQSSVDLAVNLVLYVPLGLLLRIALRRRGWHWTLQIACASLGVFALSWMMECTQAWSASRVASLWDVLSNVGMGVAGVLLGSALWSAVRHALFWLYCRLAWPVHALHIRLRYLRRSAMVLMTLVLVNTALLTAWYITQAARVFGGPAEAQADVAMPFERHFAYSYDTAAVLMGRSLLIYAAVGCLLSLSMLRSRAKRPLFWVVTGVFGVALGVEFYRYTSRGGAFRADITEPLIAVSAALLIGITAYLFAHAIRRANRRQRQSAFDGPDRRRVRYEYVDEA